MDSAGPSDLREQHEALRRSNRRTRLPGFGDPVAFAPEPPLGTTFPADLQGFQRMIDGLPEQIALLDFDWTILAINDAWSRTVEETGQTALTPGGNYRDFCAAYADSNPDAATVYIALNQMDQGRRTRFRHLYSATGPAQGHDYQVCISRIESGGRRLAIIARYEVTALRTLEQKCRRPSPSSSSLSSSSTTMTGRKVPERGRRLPGDERLKRCLT